MTPADLSQARTGEMVSMSTKQQENTYDPGQRRQSQRAGREKGIRVFIPAEVLLASGLDPDAPPPSYRVWPGTRGGVRLRLYGGREAVDAVGEGDQARGRLAG